MDIMVKKSLVINREQADTKFIIGKDLISNINDLSIIPENTSGFIVIADKNVTSFYGSKLMRSLQKHNKPICLIEIEAKEENKSFNQVQKILCILLNKRVNRNFLLINLGGGIISDIGGFVASILYRGISFINIPTTLLSQVDAAIGGKTGVNFRIHNFLHKNMVGVIHMPLAVISDIDTLKTLPEKEIKNGLGEMLKYSLISKKVMISDLIQIRNGVQNCMLLSKLVSECQNIKIAVVKADPYDTYGIREKLNLGHTIGHGIESASNGKLSHGQCVATGIVVITKISMEQGLLSAKSCNEIIKNINNLGLPVTIHNLNIKRIINSIKLDKKRGTFVLIKKIGDILTNQMVEESLVQKILKEISI